LNAKETEKKLRIRKNKERGQLEHNLTELHGQIDKTNLTNYDNPPGAISSDLGKVPQSPESEPFLPPPTPIDADSPYLSSLYSTRTAAEPPPPAPEPESAQKEKDKSHHVDAILALTHEKNVIDQLILEPPPSTTTTTLIPTSISTTPVSNSTTITSTTITTTPIQSTTITSTPIITTPITTPITTTITPIITTPITTSTQTYHPTASMNSMFYGSMPSTPVSLPSQVPSVVSEGSMLHGMPTMHSSADAVQVTPVPVHIMPAMSQTPTAECDDDPLSHIGNLLNLANSTGGST